MSNWDKEVDILVVGSGAGGLLAGLVAAHNRADVLIVEKANLWGGTSATSGGGIWIPGSDVAKTAGFEDNLDDAFTYLRGLSADNVPDENIRAFVDNAAPMLRWVMANTPVQFMAFPYPDYHAENPGGSPQGYRTHLPLPINGKSLGKEIRTLRFASPAASLFGYLNWHFSETSELLYRTKGWMKNLVVNMSRYWLDLPFRLTSRKDRRLTLGNALTGGLRMALNDQGVPLWLNTPLIDLVREGDRVTGAIVEKDGKPYRIGVRKGVVLAAGGFDKNQRQHPRRRGDRRTHTQPAIGLGRAGLLRAGRRSRAAQHHRTRTAGLHHGEPERQALSERGRLLPYRRPADGAARCRTWRRQPKLDDLRP
jgi:3-oxosteroid 1-dehydrogenase